MTTIQKHVVALFVHKSSQQWVVRDAEGNFWLLPDVSTAEQFLGLGGKAAAVEVEPVRSGQLEGTGDRPGK